MPSGLLARAWALVASVVSPATSACSGGGNAAPLPTSSRPDAPPSALPAGPSFSVSLSAAEAGAAGLPALGFSFSLTRRASSAPSGTEFVVSAPSPPDTFLVVSGPPGGTELIDVKVHGGRRDAVGLKEALRAENRHGFAPGPVSEVEMAGAKRPAIAFRGGSGMAQAIGCSLLLAPGSPGAPALRITFLRSGAGPAECARVLEHADFALAVRTFRLEP